MNPVTIPFHLAIPSAVCIVGLLIIFAKRKKLFVGGRRTILWISIVVFLFIYLFIVGSATYDDICYQIEVNRLDLNKDGLFSVDEITYELNIAMGKLTNDTGRNFSFITGLFFALPFSLLSYLIGRLFVKIRQSA